MKIIDWPKNVNEIIHNRQPETIEEWARITGVLLDELSEDSLNAIKAWFNGEGKIKYLASHVRVRL